MPIAACGVRQTVRRVGLAYVSQTTAAYDKQELTYVIRWSLAYVSRSDDVRPMGDVAYGSF